MSLMRMLTLRYPMSKPRPQPVRVEVVYRDRLDNEPAQPARTPAVNRPAGRDAR